MSFRQRVLTDEIMELKQLPEMVVAIARGLTDMHFHLELTVKMDTQVANCAGAFDSRAAYGESAVLLLHF